MSQRLTHIYTRTGDAGETGLSDGARIAKDHPRIRAIGSIDELNCAIGLTRAACNDPSVDRVLETTQHRLFDLGGELSMPDTRLIRDDASAQLERALDGFNADLPALDDFVLPGGNEPAARCHLARSICRRAERDLLRLSRTATLNPASLRYLNRLSDLLFVLARVLARHNGGREVLWRKGA